MCKWMAGLKGYGFVVDVEDAEQREVFVHYTALKTQTRGWRGLYPNEYVEFSVTESDRGPVAIGVTGVRGGPLMCEAYGGGGGAYCDHAEGQSRRRVQYWSGDGESANNAYQTRTRREPRMPAAAPAAVPAPSSRDDLTARRDCAPSSPFAEPRVESVEGEGEEEETPQMAPLPLYLHGGL